jgi:hypothetical protein
MTGVAVQCLARRQVLLCSAYPDEVLLCGALPDDKCCCAVPSQMTGVAVQRFSLKGCVVVSIA